MKLYIFLKSALTCLIATVLLSCQEKTIPEIPHLSRQGKATHLIVDGKPYLALAGELHNSSSSSREYMKDIWPKLEASGMNTVLAVVEWSLVEPIEGNFDFTIVDNLIEDARTHNLRLVLLWFGAWKNGQSHYPPAWVKKNYNRFYLINQRALGNVIKNR